MDVTASGYVTVRSESPEDTAAIRSVNEVAFGRRDEADLVDALRAERMVLRSFVAEHEGQVVGHILFSRMSIQTVDGPFPAVALAPVAVLPQHQRSGIGARLIRHGLQKLASDGERAVLVLGHPTYYTRFGFSVEKALHLSNPFPAESYMALELGPGALIGINGSVQYAKAFGI